MILSIIPHYLSFSSDTLWRESTMKAAIELIFYLPATANSNEQIRSLTDVHLRQGHWYWKVLRDVLGGSEGWPPSLCVSQIPLPPSHCQPGGDEEQRKGRQRRNWFILGRARVGREREGSKRETLIKRQCFGFTTIPPLQCAVMQWCIALHGASKAFIPTLLHVSHF